MMNATTPEDILYNQMMEAEADAAADAWNDHLRRRALEDFDDWCADREADGDTGPFTEEQFFDWIISEDEARAEALADR